MRCMNEINPYASPHAVSPAAASGVSLRAKASGLPDESPAVSTDGTVLPRYIAASLDNLVAMVLGVLVAKAVAEHLQIIQLLAFVGTYLAYYLFFEGVASRTPGKLLTGLVVIQFDGERCTWRQSFIRTCFRLLEVNPALLGAIPAAISIVLSRNHQRLGDKVARTVVVPQCIEYDRIVRQIARQS